MVESKEDVRRWRLQAKELRALANSFHTESPRRMLLKAATTYEAMAEELSSRIQRERDVRRKDS
jgi:hypothetical protein